MLRLQEYLNRVYLAVRERRELQTFESLRERCVRPLEVNRRDQLSKLNRLISHAVEHVPYYRDALRNCAAYRDGTIRLESLDELSQLPLLSKQIVREQRERMHADDHRARGSYVNRSGGSTGEPLFFLQDDAYNVSNIGHFYLVKSWRGSKPHESEITIWGAPIDTFGDVKPLCEELKDFVRNRIVLNSFKMSQNDLRHYIDLLNRHRPKLIIAYAQSVYELALFAEEHGLNVRPQHAVHAAAGTLHGYMRETIERVLQCPVYNHYGCRETGAIASECPQRDGLHVMMEHTLVEVVDEQGMPVPPGGRGEVVITTLDNFSMPLIRYRMSDVAVLQEAGECACGCSYPKLKEVVGRTIDLFRTVEGEIVTPIFFKYLLGVRYNHGHIRSYQVIQEALDLIVIKIVSNVERFPREDLEKIEAKIRVVMGERCRVRFEFADEIPKTETGKLLQTICKLPDKEKA